MAVVVVLPMMMLIVEAAAMVGEAEVEVDGQNEVDHHY